jgi:kynurenine formamidase
MIEPVREKCINQLIQYINECHVMECETQTPKIACTMHYTKMIQNQNGTIVEICLNWMIYISSDAKLDGDSIYEEGFVISGSYPLQ